MVLADPAVNILCYLAQIFRHGLPGGIPAARPERIPDHDPRHAEGWIVGAGLNPAAEVPAGFRETSIDGDFRRFEVEGRLLQPSTPPQVDLDVADGKYRRPARDSGSLCMRGEQAAE